MASSMCWNVNERGRVCCSSCSAPMVKCSTRSKIVVCLALSALFVTSCASTTLPARVSRSPDVVVLGPRDVNRTVRVSVPAHVTVRLPYQPSAGMIWQLASGGAGLVEPEAPSFNPPPRGRKSGIQSFELTMTSPGRIPLILDYAKPGPIASVTKRFRVVLAGS